MPRCGSGYNSGPLRSSDGFLNLTSTPLRVSPVAPSTLLCLTICSDLCLRDSGKSCLLPGTVPPYSSPLYFSYTLISPLCLLNHVSSPVVNRSLLYRGCWEHPVHRWPCFASKHDFMWCNSCTATHCSVICKH